MQARRPLTQTVGDVISDVLYLVQTEMRLARSEIGEKFGATASVAVFAGAGAVLLLAALILLLLGLVQWLAIAGIPDEWGLLLVGGSVAIGGLVLLLRARQQASAEALLPKRTIRDLRADVDLLKEELQ
jgi:uncharacterized membrane protein YqjE